MAHTRNEFGSALAPPQRTTFRFSKVISAPFLFKSHAHQQAFFKSEIFKPALDKLRTMGAVVIDEDWTWWQMDTRGLVSVRPVRTRRSRPSRIRTT